MRYYGIALADLYRGLHTPRFISVLADHLPPDSSLGRRLGGRASLTINEQILRDIRHGQAMQMHQAAGKKGKSPPKPPEDPPTYEKRKADQIALERKAERHRQKMRRFMKQYEERGNPNP